MKNLERSLVARRRLGHMSEPPDIRVIRTPELERYGCHMTVLFNKPVYKYAIVFTGHSGEHELMTYIYFDKIVDPISLTKHDGFYDTLRYIVRKYIFDDIDMYMKNLMDNMK